MLKALFMIKYLYNRKYIFQANLKVLSHTNGP